MTLTEFLLARIDEDEKAAEFAHYMERTHFPPPVFRVRYAWQRVVRSVGGGEGVGSVSGAPTPARVLAECEAKRRIIKAWPDPFGSRSALEARTAARVKDAVLLHLAAVYSDHPDYNEAWAVTQ